MDRLDAPDRQTNSKLQVRFGGHFEGDTICRESKWIEIILAHNSHLLDRIVRPLIKFI